MPPAIPTISSPRRNPRARLRARWLATRALSNTESSAKTCGFWKRLPRPRTSSATLRPPGVQSAHDAPRHHEDGEDEDDTVEDGAHFRAKVDGVRQPGEDERPHDGTDEGALAPQQHHGQHFHGLVDAEIARIDVARVVAVEPARKGGEGIADGEGEELVA